MTSQTKKTICLCSVVLLITTLASCTDHRKLENDLNKYQQRTASVVDATLPEQTELDLLNYPLPSSTRIDIQQINIRLTEFYALQGCPVTTLIAERNTALGKIQLPSKRYTYEVRLLEGLKDCIQRQDQDANTLPLNQWLEAKTRQLPAVWADMLQNSSEIKRTLASNDGFIQGSVDDNFSTYYQALRFIVELKDSPSDDIVVIEEHLKTLQQTPLLSRMASTQNLLSIRLSQTSDWLIKQVPSLNCERPSKKQQITHLENVFNRYFVNQIQAVAAKLTDYHYKLSPLLQKLINSEELSPAFIQLLEEQQQSFVRYQQAMFEHIKIWQSILKTCN